MNGFFITSTDTDAGKTTISLSLMQRLKRAGKIVSCMKPVSAGCELTSDGLRNSDAVKLLAESSLMLPYELINPYAFKPPIAPHIAAHKVGEKIEIETIVDNFRKITDQSDIVIVEGAGGWLVPINEKQTMADIATALQLPVVLVVGLRLGCLNHALLTAKNIIDTQVPFAGWIANHVDPEMLQQQENIESLNQRINAPLLGVVAFKETPGHNISLTQAGESFFNC